MKREWDEGFDRGSEAAAAGYHCGIVPPGENPYERGYVAGYHSGAILSLECTVCGARPGVRCVNHTTDGEPRRPHVLRVAAWRVAR